MKVVFNNLNEQWQTIRSECMQSFDKLFAKSDFILGSAVAEFEDKFADFVGSKYAVGVSNGTDALKLAAQALNLQGSVAVIIPANTFVATILGIEQAIPHADFNLVDCDEHHQLDVKLTRKLVEQKRKDYDNVMIVPVHLYGYACNMNEILDISKEHNCVILEDTSQAHGTRWKDGVVGNFGHVSAYSLYPGKNLGAAGDAGIVTTNDEKVFHRLKMLRNLGSVEKYKHQIKGSNNRLDTIQAIVLNEKIKYIDQWNQSRREVVKQYEQKMKNKNVILPTTPENCLPTHHVYPVRVKNRDTFMSYLKENNVQCGIHYPICIEKMEMYAHLSKPNKNALKFSEEMVSLPIHPFMKSEEVDYLCEVINSYAPELL